jgi:hypothetical protein
MAGHGASGRFMKMVAEYLEHALNFERMAAAESDPQLKANFEKQAAAYRKLAMAGKRTRHRTATGKLRYCRLGLIRFLNARLGRFMRVSETVPTINHFSSYVHKCADGFVNFL